MHVLITGANGFIGRHLAPVLLEAGHWITAPVRETADTSALASLANSLCLVRVASLAADGQLRQTLENVNAVVHLAGRAHVMRESASDPLAEYRKANVETTAQLASAAGRAGVRRFIFISSITVNGDATNGTPFSANDAPAYCGPYGKSKWEAEERLREIAASHQMEWVIVRPPLVYGPAVRGNFLSLLQCVRSGIPLPLGGIRNQRSLVSVYNLTDFIVRLLEHSQAANRRFVVADRYDLSTPELIRAVAAALHRPARLVSCPEAILKKAGVLLGQRAAFHRLCSSLVVDRGEVENLLGWSAPASLEWGLEQTAHWFLGRIRES